MTEMGSQPSAFVAEWPDLPLQEWQDTYATLHMWTQIVGKIRLRLSPRSTTTGMCRSTSPRED